MCISEMHHNSIILSLIIVENVDPVASEFHCVKNVRIQSYSGLHFSCIFPHSE